MEDQSFSKGGCRGAGRGRRPHVRAGRSIAESGAGLSTAILRPEFRSRMEQAFGEGFSDVVVRSSRVVDAHFGGVAVTVGRSILIGSRFTSLTSHCRERVLAHELAHVVQKRRSTGTNAKPFLDPRYRARLEAEAHLAAIVAPAGGRAECRLSDAPWIPSAWGPAGHYWTCYFVMLAAGVNENEAQERAFFCQMPDQVREFDASRAGIDWVEFDLAYPRGLPLAAPGLGQFFPSTEPTSVPLRQATPLTSHGLDTRFDKRTDLIEQVPEALAEAMANRRMDLDISEGLHSLTGGAASAELTYREQQLGLFAEDPLVFGLALHAYGDSYTHVDRDDGAGGGNANPRAARSSLYRQYVGNLYRIVCATLGGKRGRRIGEAAVLDALREVSDMRFGSQTALLDDFAGQRLESQIIRDAIGRFLNRAPSSSFQYAPEEEEEVYWRQFWPRYPDIMSKAGGQQIVFDQVRKMGQLWRT